MEAANKPIVSIIIPVYNVEAYFADCLKAVRAQTFADWELILVDDGSTDGSVELLVSKLHQTNSGPSRARNAGIDAAQGQFIAFVDADDLIEPAYLEKMVDAANTYGSDLALCGFVRFRDGVTQEYLLSRIPIGLFGDMSSFMLVYGEARTNMFGVSIWAKLYRKEILDRYGIRFDPEITYEEDCNFNADYLSRIHTAVAVGEALYRYRQMDVSLSKSYRKDTFRFLVHGYHRRRELLKQYGRNDLLPAQERIFLIVVKMAALKIFRSGLPRREKLSEYRNIMDFPESQQVATKENCQGSVTTRMIVRAVRKKAPRHLSFVVRLWDIADRIHNKLIERKQG